MDKVKIFSGNSHPQLATAIAQLLTKELVSAQIDSFSNGEIRVQVDNGLNNNLRNYDIVIIQTGGTAQVCTSVNDVIMETLLMVNTAKLSSAKSITLVMPCFPYSRQDKKDKPRSPISAKLIANMFENAGVDRLVTLDLHASQIAGFFNIPVDNLYCIKIMADYLLKEYNLGADGKNTADWVLVSPDAGGIKRMDSLAKLLGMKTAIMHKQRSYELKNTVLKTILIGDENCVRDKIAVLVDDICDTAGTICQAAQTLIEHGVREVKVLVTHGVLSGPAIKRLFDQKLLTQVIVTDSLPITAQLLELQSLKEDNRQCIETMEVTKSELCKGETSTIVNAGSDTQAIIRLTQHHIDDLKSKGLVITQISAANLLADTIKYLFTPGHSVSDLFKFN